MERVDRRRRNNDVQVLAIAAGSLVLALTVTDLVWTTIAASGGGGPVTSRFAHGLWHAARKVGRGAAWHEILRLSGVAIVIVTLLTWMLSLWLGWALVFHGATDAVVDASTGQPASTLERFYFTGTTITTLGLGDLIPGGAAWGMAVAVSAGTGLVFATLAITYLIPVVEAVNHRREIALSINALGRDPHAIVVDAWRDGSFGRLEDYLVAMVPRLSRLGQQHLTYPIIHYFHNVAPEGAAPVRLAMLDEALMLLECGLEDDAALQPAVVGPAREAIHSVIGTLTAAYITRADEPPAPPSLEPLRAAGMPTVSDEVFVRRVEAFEARRRALVGFVRDDGWGWHDVYPERDGETSGARGSVASEPEDEAA